MPHDKTSTQIRGFVADAPFGDDIGILSRKGVTRGKGLIVDIYRLASVEGAWRQGGLDDERVPKSNNIVTNLKLTNPSNLD